MELMSDYGLSQKIRIYGFGLEAVEALQDKAVNEKERKFSLYDCWRNLRNGAFCFQSSSWGWESSSIARTQSGKPQNCSGWTRGFGYWISWRWGRPKINWSIAEDDAGPGETWWPLSRAGGSGRSKGDGPVDELTDEGIAYTLDINLKSLLYSNRTAIRQFRKQGQGGVILNMGSVLGYSPAPEHFCTHVYTATKAAAIGFTQSLAAKYAPENIRANIIAPGLVETPMAGRAASNSEIMEFVSRKQPLDGGP